MSDSGTVVVRCSRLLARYWVESRRPLVSLAFVAPMLIAYEGGLLLLGPHSMRNGADLWLRRLLENLGFSQYFLLPLLTCGILLGWHHVKREPWSVSLTSVNGMLFESSAFGAVLLLVARWQSCLPLPGASRPLVAWSAESGGMGPLVAFLGAGIYEELLFRLMLLPAAVAVIRGAGASWRVSLFSAVVAGSVLFAAAHYRWDVQVGAIQFGLSAGESFEWMSFCFRALAGVFFSLLFWYRGFGVAAGSHAIYDILVAEW